LDSDAITYLVGITSTGGTRDVKVTPNQAIPSTLTPARILVDSPTDNGVDAVQVNGSMQVTGFSANIRYVTASSYTTDQSDHTLVLDTPQSYGITLATPQTTGTYGQIIYIVLTGNAGGATVVADTGSMQGGSNSYTFPAPNMSIAFHYDPGTACWYIISNAANF
jgi:hypothetical protein